jgi:L-alanine-DL-glutamate epimerase-like enolase superfamily enzyme
LIVGSQKEDANLDNPRIVFIEWGCLRGWRPRTAGSNARLNEHGRLIHLPILRLRTEDGSCGFGLCSASREQASTLLGKRLDEVFLANKGVKEPWLAFDYPLWDLMGQRTGLPVYVLAALTTGVTVNSPFRVPCYDTSLYFDDLHLSTNPEAVQLLATEALEGYRRGHRAFKIKVGRGARHMPLEEGTLRDIAVVHGVREALGPDVALMLDANNGYNLNLAKRVLMETADCQVFWLEEAFHEDDVLYRDLHTWLVEHDLPVLISDGDGRADPSLLEWAQQGLVDVIQYDILDHGFTRWLATGRLLDAWGVRAAPHHYGWHYGNYAACHLAGAIRGFVSVEWDEATTPGLDASGYALAEGWVSVPERPGFGLTLDEAVFQYAVAEAGFVLSH